MYLLNATFMAFRDKQVAPQSPPDNDVRSHIMTKKSKPSPAKKAKPAKTPVRNSAIPKPSTPPSKKPAEFTHDVISRRAYFIHISGKGGSQTDNWYQALRELRAGA
jgi:hypothetical protein